MKPLRLLLFLFLLPLSTGVSHAQRRYPGDRTSALQPGEVFLSNAKWIHSVSLEEDVSRYSTSFGYVLRAMKRVSTEWHMIAREGAEIRFYGVARQGFPVEISYMHVGDNWTIRLDRADNEKEGPHAPNILLITADGGWELIDRDLTGKKPETFLVASGNW